MIYVALGDSTVEVVGATAPATSYPSRIAERLRALYADARFENLGVAGTVASGVVATHHASRKVTVYTPFSSRESIASAASRKTFSMRTLVGST